MCHQLKDHPVEKRLPDEPKLSPERTEELKERLRLEITEKLIRSIGRYKSGTVVLKFHKKDIPDIIFENEGRVNTGDEDLYSILTKYGVNRLHTLGSALGREKLKSELHKYVYADSPELKDKAMSFQRVVNRRLTNLMKEFEIELDPGTDKSYREICSLNLKRAMKDLEGEYIDIELWGRDMSFRYGDGDGAVDSFTKEAIEALKSHPEIEEAFIESIHYARSDPNQGVVVDYYGQKQTWNLDYSTGGHYPRYNELQGQIDWFYYSWNAFFDEDGDAHVVWDKNLDFSYGGRSLATGEPVVVAVIDSGLDFNHPEFPADRMWISPPGENSEDINGNGVFDPWLSSVEVNGVYGDIDGEDNDGNGYVDDVVGWNFCGANLSVSPKVNNSYLFSNGMPSVVPYDDRGHGTAVAGVLGAANDNWGVKGIAYSSKLLIIKSVDNTGWTNNSAAAIVYAKELKLLHGVNIVAVNCSWSGGTLDPAVSTAILDAVNAGIVVVIAVGNDGVMEPFWLTPEAFEAAIMVGYNDYNSSVPSNWSNDGIIDVVAPGEDIILARASDSVYPASAILDGAEHFRLASGTSYAAPQVSGLAALTAANYPDWTPGQIKQRIRDAAEPLYEYSGYLELVQISSSKQGEGKVNTTSICASQASVFTSGFPAPNPNYIPAGSHAAVGVCWEHQLEANGIIDAVFKWAEGYEPPDEGMVLDQGIGLITWTPTNANWGANEVRVVAKNLANGDEVQQTFTVNVGASTDPNDYMNFDNPVVGPLMPEDVYYPDEESYRFSVTMPAPFVELPNAGTTWITPTVSECNHVHYMYSFPEYDLSPGLLVNGLPLISNGYEFITGSYPPISILGYQSPFLLGYTGPDWWNGELLWQDILLVEGGVPDPYFPPFDSQYSELLVYNPPALRALYRDSWDIDCYQQFSGRIKIHAHEFIHEPGGSCECPYGSDHVIIDLSEEPGFSFFDLKTINWQDPSQFEEYTIRPKGTIYYTNSKTGDPEPLEHTKLRFFSVYSGRVPYVQMSEFYWTDGDGYFESEEELTYNNINEPPSLVIYAQCRDGDDDELSPIIAEVVKTENVPYNSEQYPVEESMVITLTPEFDGTANSFSNILMEIYDTYQFLKENTNLMASNFGGLSSIRDKMTCYWGDYYNSYYDSSVDRIKFGPDLSLPFGSGPGWYEIRANYVLGVMQWQCGARGIEEINWDGGVQDFTGMVSELTALTWGFADFVALRVDGEEQINIDYLGVTYDMERIDFENFSSISDPTRSEGVGGGIFLDMADRNFDPADELNGSMYYGFPGRSSNFSYIFENMINTAYTATQLGSGHEFTIVDFYWNWLNEGYPDPEETYGIFLGHGISVPEPPGIQQGP